MLVHDFLRRSAERTTDAVAIIQPSARATYAGVNRLANRAGKALFVRYRSDGGQLSLVGRRREAGELL
jgi:non-ribosomal peptide synthetase component E (peptide arylation enzyme)